MFPSWERFLHIPCFFFKRSIFPVVGLIKDPWHYKPNPKWKNRRDTRPCLLRFGKLLSLLHQFGQFKAESKEIATCFPCMTIKQEDNTEEILWEPPSTSFPIF
jgi:hypothetical protein